MNHNFIEQPPLNDKILDRYFICDNCGIIKVIRKNGNIHFLFKTGIAGKLLNNEPACLKVIK